MYDSTFGFAISLRPLHIGLSIRLKYSCERGHDKRLLLTIFGKLEDIMSIVSVTSERQLLFSHNVLRVNNLGIFWSDYCITVSKRYKQDSPEFHFYPELKFPSL